MKHAENASSTPSPYRTLRWLLLAKAVVGIVLTLTFFGGWWLKANGFTALEFQNELRRGGDARFGWRSVERRHWQALGRTGEALGVGEPPETTDAREANTAGCGTGMVRVKGSYRVELHGEATGEIERIQDAACVDWISRDFPARCRTFDRSKIAEEVAKLPTRPLDFCMDRFEYPNVLGQNPVIVVTFHEAEAHCKKSSKRLCNESEWTFACEGEEVRPYPYGWQRDSTACVVDRTWRPFAEGALSPRDGQGARTELDRLWQAEPSGSRNACKSPFGIYDMTGNVDEWTRTVRPTGYASILKGGYWGPVRARCRPATRAHNEDFVAYQQGFRCCGDADSSVAAPAPAPASAPGPAYAAPRGRGAPVADLSAEWPEGVADGDEAEAIGRARVGLTCAASRAVGGPSPNGPAWAMATTALLAAVSLRRRRATRSGDGGDR